MSAITKFLAWLWYMRGFDRRGCTAAITRATAVGLTLSGYFSDLADFVVMMLFDVDDLFGHLTRNRYLLDGDVSGLVLDFDVAPVNTFSPLSQKFASVPWASLSYILQDGTSGTIGPKPGDTIAANLITSSSGQVQATGSVTVSASAYSPLDHAQIILLGNVVYDVIVPSTGLSFPYFASGVGSVHNLTIGGTPYNYTEIAGDSSTDIATKITLLAAADTNAAVTSAANVVSLAPRLDTGAIVVCSGTGSAPGNLYEITSGVGTALWAATALAAAISGGSILFGLTASASGATVNIAATSALYPGTDGNTIGLWCQGSGAISFSTGYVGLTGGVDATIVHYHVDFSALLGSGATQLRQCWLTVAPRLPISAGANPPIVPFSATDFSWTVSNVALSGAGNHDFKVAGANSVVVGSQDVWTTAAGSWAISDVGTFYHGFAIETTALADTVTVFYSCQAAHNLYLGTVLNTDGGKFGVTVDGVARADLSLYAGARVICRRQVATGVAAGTHTVVFTVKAGTGGNHCWFDFLHAVVAADPTAPAVTYSNVSAASDSDTDQTYKISVQRMMWNYRQLGLLGDTNIYAGVFFALKRVRYGGSFHTATITVGGTITSGDAVFVTVGTTTFGVGVYAWDTIGTVTQRIIDGINGLFIGVRTTTSGAGNIGVTLLTPVNGFNIAVASGSSLTLTLSPSVNGLIAGNEGIWQVDASATSPLNRAFADWLADVCVTWAAAGMTFTLAFSQELLAPPDVNTSAGAWIQRFYNSGTATTEAVLTATEFGSWGAGYVEGVSGSAPFTVLETAHGYSTGYLAHMANNVTGAVYQITVTDANHWQGAKFISGDPLYAPAIGDTVLVELQTSQCCFNPATMTAYMTAVYKQAAAIIAAAGVAPKLQFGEILWWFFSRVFNKKIGFASWTAPISIGTVENTDLTTGERAIVANVEGNTAADGNWPLVYVDPTHVTLTGSNGNGAYVAATGTINGGGMAYYDAYTNAAALAALGRPLANFQTPDDDPSVNSCADANFLYGQIQAHVHAIRVAVLAATPTVVFELLWPYDVNWYTSYASPMQGLAPIGGRLNRYVNLPPAWSAPGSDIDLWKTEALAWGTTYRDLNNAKASIAFYATDTTWSASSVSYLVPWQNGGCPWPAEFVLAVGAGLLAVNLWALDHYINFSWENPLPTSRLLASSTIE